MKVSSLRWRLLRLSKPAAKNDMVDGGFTFVQAYPHEPLRYRSRNAKRTKNSPVASQPKSGIKTLKDLNGKTVVGSQSSTSGHLMPRAFLLKEGLIPTAFRVAFSGAHDATALQVAGGKVDVGALNISVWEKLARWQINPTRPSSSHHTTLLRLQLTVRGDLDRHWSRSHGFS
jgi:phosphonate transport system substrate-binding protein